MKQTILLCMLGIICLHTKAQVSEPKPNIIFIVVDDLNDWVSGYSGHPQSSTKYIGRIQKFGTTFKNTECVAPICGPSRTSLLSGKDVFYTQDYTNSKCIPFRDKFTEAKGNATLFTMPEYLKDSVGYYTYNVGKVFDCHSNNVAYYDYDDVTVDRCSKSLSWNEYYSPDGNESHVLTSYADTLNAGISDFTTCAVPNEMEASMYDYLNAEKAVNFINEVADGSRDICNKPFAMYFGIRKPHTPWILPEKYFLPYYDADYAADDYTFTFNTNALPPYNGVVMPPQPPMRWEDYYNLPATGLAKSLADISNCEDSIINKINALASEGFFESYGTDSNYLGNMEESVRANMIMAYLAGIKFMDAQIGKVFNALKAHPDMYNNTILVILSDNAFNHGEKRHWSKAALWEESVRVPFIIADLRNPVKKTVTRQVSLLDLYPTILDLIDATEPVFPDGTPYLDGHSLTGLMANPHLVYESPALITFKSLKGMQLSCNPQYAVKDNNYKYIRYQSNNLDQILSCNVANSYYEEELYNIGEKRNVDPYEWDNLISDPAYTAEKEYLQQFLPGNAMYLMRSLPVDNAETGYPCMFQDHDNLRMQALVYDEDGNVLTQLPEHCIYKWHTSVNNDNVASVTTVNFPVHAFKQYASEHAGKFHVYLQIYDTVLHASRGFKMFDFYTDAAMEPEISFVPDVKENGLVYLNEVQYKGSLNSVEWQFGDTEIFEGFAPPAHSYAAAGEYTISAVANFGNGDCQKIFSQNILVEKSDSPSEFEVFAFPDPATDVTKIFFPVGLQDPLISVCSMDGNCIKEYVVTTSGVTSQLQIHVEDLPAGMYTFKTEDKGIRYFGKVIVIH